MQAELLHDCVCGFLNGLLGLVVSEAHQLGVVNFLQEPHTACSRLKIGQKSFASLEASVCDQVQSAPCLDSRSSRGQGRKVQLLVAKAAGMHPYTGAWAEAEILALNMHTCRRLSALVSACFAVHCQLISVQHRQQHRGQLHALCKRVSKM